MQTHNLIQGSPEWHAYRAEKFNASDAPAMMGVSPYKTRSELLRERATGLTEEVGPEKQRIFDSGHRFEALARPLAEAIIGEDLYPVTGSHGQLSASFDGLTMLEDVAFEHKTLNAELRAVMTEGCTGSDLPQVYQIQMEQQCMVAGCNRVLFMASKWDANDQLIEARHCWYTSNPILSANIEAGWAQFAADLSSWSPEPSALPAPAGRAPETLPALRIEVTGAVTASNLAEFKSTALAVFKGINRDLVTDSDFADAEKTVKWCSDVEGRLKAAKEHALSQTETIDALFKAIDDISTEARQTRLDLEKLVKARKEEIRHEIVRAGRDAYDAHILALNQRLGKPLLASAHRNIPEPDFAGAIKGKRTVDSLRDAVNTSLATAKIEASAIADRVQINLGTLRELAANHAFLFADTQQIVMKAADDLTLLVKSRIADHEAKEAARLEAQREAIRKEEAERVERQQREAAAQAAQNAFQPIAESPLTHRPVDVPPPAQQAEAVTVDDGYVITTGEICNRLGLTVTVDFLKARGFTPVASKTPGTRWPGHQFPRMCLAIAAHVAQCAETQIPMAA
jgi:putative phage-type endonuclease